MEYSSLDVRFKSEIRLRSFSPLPADMGRLFTGGGREGLVSLQLPGKTQNYREGCPHVMGDTADPVGAGAVLFGNKSPRLVELAVDLRQFASLREADRLAGGNRFNPRKMGVTAFSTCRVFFQISRTTTMILVRKTAASPTSSFLA